MPRCSADGADHHPPPFDGPPAADVIGGREIGDAAVGVIAGEAREAAHLAEAAVVQQELDAFAAPAHG